MSLRPVSTYCANLQTNTECLNAQLKVKLGRSWATALRLMTLPALQYLKSDLRLLQR